MDKNKQDQPEVTAPRSLFKKADGTEEKGEGRDAPKPNNHALVKSEILAALRNGAKKRAKKK